MVDLRDLSRTPPPPNPLLSRGGELFSLQGNGCALVEKNAHQRVCAGVSKLRAAKSITAFTCSRLSPSNQHRMSLRLAPASRFSKIVATGMRVPRSTQAPLTLPGTLSSAAIRLSKCPTFSRQTQWPRPSGFRKMCAATARKILGAGSRRRSPFNVASQRTLPVSCHSSLVTAFIVPSAPTSPFGKSQTPKIRRSGAPG